jgi:DHA2 family methylenomycin A resistance protein-like MFS transporter
MGALLTASLTWRGVFFVNIPVGLVAILLVNSFTTHSIVKTHKQFDLSGQLLGILVIASLAFSLIEAGRYGWQATQVIIPLIIFIISLMAFIWVENRVAQPVLPLTFFANKHFTIVMTVGLFLNLGVYGELFLLPLYFQQVRGYSVLTAGFAIFPLVALIGISSFLSGKLVSYKGAKLPLCLGLIIGALGFLGLLTIGQNSPDYYWLILPLAAIGSGIAFAMPAATVIAIQAVPKERAGMASATFTTSRQLGSLLGVAIFGTILASTSDFVTGMRITLVIAGLLFMLGLVLAYFIGPHASAHH